MEATTVEERRPRDRLKNIITPFFGKKSKKDMFTNFSAIPENEITVGVLEIWNNLPESIKNDPCFEAFKSVYEKQSREASNASQNLSTHNVTGDTDIESVPVTNSEPLLQSQSSTENKNADLCYCKNVTENARPIRIHPVLVKQISDLGNYTQFSKQNDNLHFLSYHGKKIIFSRPKTKPVNFMNESLSTKLLVNSPNNRTEAEIPSCSGQCNVAENNANVGHKKIYHWMQHAKIFLLLVCWIAFTTILIMKCDDNESQQVSISVNRSDAYFILNKPEGNKIEIKIRGPFMPKEYKTLSKSYLNVWLDSVEFERITLPLYISFTEFYDEEITTNGNVSSLWKVPLVESDKTESMPIIEHKKVFHLTYSNVDSNLLRVLMKSDQSSMPNMNVSTSANFNRKNYGILYASILLVGLYTLIIFEIVHRTFAAILASTTAIAFLTILGDRPTTMQLVTWIDVETLLLLFSMMVIVGIVSETGIFDYLAVFAYKVTKGKNWPLINCLCFFTGILSSILDNVTTILLMTPVTIRLCEVMELNPIPILMSMIIFSNIGGTLTPIGDPPNVIISSNIHVQEAGINFASFTLHMFLGIIFVIIQAYVHLRIYYKDPKKFRRSEPTDIQDLKRELTLWQETASNLSDSNEDEVYMKTTINSKINFLQKQLKKRLKTGAVEKKTFNATLVELTAKYPIRDKVLLIKCCITVTFLMLFFFLHSIPELDSLSLGWTALLGAILLLIISDRKDIEVVLARVEWSTLLFFGALFILMEALAKLGLINWIGKQTENIITSVSEESRLTVAILLILWVSAIASAFVDNIPLTTMMIRIATDLGMNPELNLPLKPLIWALAFGACLGGNGTLIGASTNVVCAGVAEQHGYHFSFTEYFKIGFPLMIGSIIVITFYLLFCHVVFQWH